MKQPVIFLAFANDQDNHLALLDEERKAISKHLVPLASEQYFQLFIEPTATISDLTQYISSFKDRIVIFHYGGHADSTVILLQGQAANANGVAQLLAIQPNLQLVFLNGCSTRAQVNLLFELGIPAVIATSVPIADPSASTFSNVFYQALADQHTLEEAFKLASANHLMASGQAASIFRGIKIKVEDTDSLPWGLYVNQGKEATLNWKLPRESAGSFIVRGAGMKYQPGTTMNQKLIETIANSISPYSFKIKAMMEDARSKGREPKIRDLRVAVIDSFPTPIGMHLRKLLISEDISTDRLQKIVNLYQVSAQFLGYILVAQLWDEKVKQPNLAISIEQEAIIKNFLGLNAADSYVYNFITLIRTIGEILANNQIETFVVEFVELQEKYNQDSDFQKAILFLEEMKKELLGSVSADEIESFCVQAEDHLIRIFSRLGFSAKYTLATIKTIELMKARHANPRYKHNLVILNQLTAAIGVLDDVLESDEFSDNNSVILMRDEETVQPSLNLSPFLIDENALSGQQNSKLFFFTSRQDGVYSFTLIDNLKDQLAIKDDTYPYIRELLLAFENALK
jgi:hypothetical protein